MKKTFLKNLNVNPGRCVRSDRSETLENANYQAILSNETSLAANVPKIADSIPASAAHV